MRTYLISAVFFGYGLQVYRRSSTSKIQCKADFIDEMARKYKTVLSIELTEEF